MTGIDLTDFENVEFAEDVSIGTGLIQLWVQNDVPTAAKLRDVWIDTDNFSRYDKLELSASRNLLVSDNEMIIASGTITITLHNPSTPGIIKKIYNIGTGIVTIVGAETSYLYPGESVEFITDGSGWRV